MSARVLPTNVAMSNFGVPLTGLVQKTPAILSNAPAGYAWAGDVDSDDAISVGADYGIYDTTNSLNCPVEVTNWKDPV